jgi:hypothetical protein
MERIDKLTETHSFRIPEITKHKIEQLPGGWKKKLNEALLMTIAKTLHEAEFDYIKYLSSE